MRACLCEQRRTRYPIAKPSARRRRRTKSSELPANHDRLDRNGAVSLKRAGLRLAASVCVVMTETGRFAAAAQPLPPESTPAVALMAAVNARISSNFREALAKTGQPIKALQRRVPVKLGTLYNLRKQAGTPDLATVLLVSQALNVWLLDGVDQLLGVRTNRLADNE